MTSAYPRSAARIAGIAAAILLFAGEAFAQGTLQPVQSTLQTLVQAPDWTNCDVACHSRGHACGFLAFTGRLTWGIAGSVIFGIVLVLAPRRSSSSSNRLLDDDENDLEKPLIVPLVRALTRAPTLMGVPYMYFMMNGVATAVIFLASHNLAMLSLQSRSSLRVRDDPSRRADLRDPFRALDQMPPRSRTFWGADSYSV